MTKSNAIFLYLVVMLLWSCKDESPLDYAIISGTVANANDIELTLEKMDRSFSKTIAVKANGSFRDTLQISDGASFAITDTENRLMVFLQPAYRLQIDYDFDDLANSLKISGKGAPDSNYFVEKQKKEKELFEPYGRDNPFYKLGEKDFKALVQTHKTTLKELLNTTDSISDEFKSIEHKDLDYLYLMFVSDYEMAHRHFTENPDFKASEAFLDELKNIDYANGKDYAISNSYRALVRRHYGNKASELAQKDSLDRDSILVKIFKKIPDTTVREGMLFERAQSGITYAKDLESYYADFMASSSNEEHKARITEIYEQQKNLMPGMPSPVFEDYENYAGGTTSLSDLSGKYLYVDVWATWCGPCIMEIPALQEVEGKYHDKNIEFVSIAIDRPTDKEKWRKMVDEKALKGIQLFADKEWNSGFVKDYQIMGIPRFLLIAPDGTIVNANAPRPSDPQLTKTLDSLAM